MTAGEGRGGTVRRWALRVALALGVLGVGTWAAFQLSPWPSVLAIRWVFDRGVPALNMRGNGAPVTDGTLVYLGYDDGSVVALRVTDGTAAWEQEVAAPGTTGVEVFETPIGRIALLICYDDTYWQYARLALLHDVDVLAWSSASDRVMPGSPKPEFKLDHSTIANVQYLSRYTGAWVVAATRNGIETNPKTGQKLLNHSYFPILIDSDYPLSREFAIVPPLVCTSGGERFPCLSYCGHSWRSSFRS